MKSKIVNSLLVLVLLLSLFGCTSKPKLTKYNNTSLSSGFNTAISLIGYCKSQEEFDKYFEIMCNEFQHYNQLFDRYNDYPDVANIKTINDNAGIQPCKVDQVIIDMLLEAKEYYDLSNGAFDITVGSVLEIWHTYREKGIAQNEEGITDPEVPSLEQLKAAYVPNGWDYIQINDEENTVYISNPQVSLDVGGIAKGYATELVGNTLISEGLTSGAINGGGNVKLLGPKPDNTKWAIGITEPDNTAVNSGIFYNSEPYCYVTSGDYQRYYTSNGVNYSHIMDTSSLMPATNYRSVTVVATDSGVADCLSTAIFILNQSVGLELINQYNATHSDFIGAYWIYDSTKKPTDIETVEVDGYWVLASDNIKDKLNIYGATKE